MKRLLITTDSFLPRWDGIARFLTELIPYLKEDFKITIVCPAFDGNLPQIPDVEIIRFPLFRVRFGDIFFSKFDKKKMRKIVSEHDLVFNQSLGPIGISAIKAAKKQNKPLIGYVHSVDWELASKSIMQFKSFVWWIVKRIARKNYNKFSLVLVPSKEIKELFSLEGINSEKQVIKLGVDTKKFVPSVNKKDLKAKMGFDPEHIIITYIGRTGREKKLTTLYNAFEQMRTKAENKVMMLIVGEGVPEEIASSEHVLAVGPQDDVVPFYQASDIYVLPSLTETTSLTTLEAMSCGCAVVATPVGSIREYIEDGQNGMIFPRRDVNTLADTLLFLTNRPESISKLGSAARKTVEENRDFKKSAIKIRNALKNY
jgi:glycosyltransferase involved in cell wall biosynthesis